MTNATDSPKDDLEKATLLLRGEGLAMPPIPKSLKSQLVERGKWCFSTRSLPVSPYDLEHYVKEARAGAAPEYLLLAHAGHGANSYAMHYFLVQRPLRLFLQIGWGGVYMNKLVSTKHVNDCFRLAEKVVKASETAALGGKLSLTDRMTVVASDFYGGFWHVSRRSEHSAKRRRIAGNRNCSDSRDILKEALDWYSLEGGVLFGTSD